MNGAPPSYSPAFGDQPGTLSTGRLNSLVKDATCRVFGHAQASNDAHRFVVGSLIRSFPNARATILCEPSLIGNSFRPPDVVLVDEEAGVSVIEVKGIGIESIADVQPGGTLLINYGGGAGPKPKDVIQQVRKSMFQIKNTVEAEGSSEPLEICFNYWVHFPRVRRSDWRWNFCPPEFLFQEDNDRLGAIVRDAGVRWLKKKGLDYWSDQELQATMRAFGDNAVLYPTPARRPERKVQFGTLGEHFDDSARAYKNMSEEQRTLSEAVWEDGPRLVRGVAGSGKTIVLANNLARRLERIASTPSFLSTPEERVRIGVFCFNRTLVPFLKEKIERAYFQRTGRELATENRFELTVCILNELYMHWSGALDQKPWSYLPINVAKEKWGDDDAMVANRTDHYLSHLLRFKGVRPLEFEHLLFDTIYVDEGQDLHPSEIQLLTHLCKKPSGGEANLIIFYDDAQNLYARPRPNWKELGLNLIGGRSTIMTRCHRNPKRVIETAFNVLYGTCAESKAKRPSREFGDIAGLEAKELIRLEGSLWRLNFAAREGAGEPRVRSFGTWNEEQGAICETIVEFIERHQVRPQDILVLANNKKRLVDLEKSLKLKATGKSWTVHNATLDKNSPLNAQGKVTLSTVHSAKGYDAYVVMIAAANDFEDSVEDRATFYVGCTRALELLEVSAHQEVGLHKELEAATARLRG